ncbi:MAG: uridine diphosphate-N-acetylglucosamine-binding protein YvcK [Nitriliruptoraceae bacterium]
MTTRSETWPAVAIGGGHGTAKTLMALRSLTACVTAVVTVADDGGSSGRLRREMDVLPPGDLRMALVALAERPELAELLQFRFSRGELSGHSLGNLIIVALQELLDGDLLAALERVGTALGLAGRVLPCTTDEVHLRARTVDGEISGQTNVAKAVRIEQVWLEPKTPTPTPAVLDAITDARLIVVGPGSLYTSILPNLLIPSIATAITQSTATVVYVANLREQLGETQGMTFAAHLDAVLQHAPELRIDVLLAHAGPPVSGSLPALTVKPSLTHPHVGQLVVADLIGQDTDSHDPAALAEAFKRILAGA